jgi:hypothetical protein
VSVLQSLRWIFWGVLVVAVTVWVNGFDVLNDVLGYAIIAVGMIGLVKNPIGGRYGLLTKFVTAVALLNAFWAPFAECSGRMALVEKIAGVGLGILSAFATVGFCIVMRRLCEAIPLNYAEKSWRRSLLFWNVGLPASVAATCLSWWSTKNNLGEYSTDSTPLLALIPLVALSLIALAVLIHSFISLGRTIAGLKGMMRQLPAASDFGLDKPPSFRFQFSIRALMIVTAAVAVIAAGFSQATIPYWQFTMAGLIALSLLAMRLDHRTLSKGLLVVVAIVLFAGHAQIGHCGTSGGVGSIIVPTDDSSPGFSIPEPVLADIDAWLAARGFDRSDPPSDYAKFPIYGRLDPRKSEPAIWYAGKTPRSPQFYLRIRYSPIGEHLLQLQVDYRWYRVDFPWIARKEMQQVTQFSTKMAERLKEYDDELHAIRQRAEKSHSKP